MERKKLIEIIGSIFVAAIFLSSYAAFGNISQSGNNATTTALSQTYYAVANTNAMVQSYASTFNINITCSNASAVSGTLNSELAGLEKNGSVANFYSQQAAQILVQSGSMSSNALYARLSNDIGSGASCTQFSGTANIDLPGRMNFYVTSQRSSVIITIPDSLRAYSLPIPLAGGMGGTLSVSVSALLEQNGTIYGPLRVAKA